MLRKRALAVTVYDPTRKDASTPTGKLQYSNSSTGNFTGCIIAFDCIGEVPFRGSFDKLARLRYKSKSL